MGCPSLYWTAVDCSRTQKSTLTTKGKGGETYKQDGRNVREGVGGVVNIIRYEVAGGRVLYWTLEVMCVISYSQCLSTVLRGVE